MNVAWFFKMGHDEAQPQGSTLRDAYGFVVHPAYAELHRQYTPLWAEEELERQKRWSQWLQAYRKVDPPADGSWEDDSQVLERALAQFSQSGTSGPAQYAAALLKQLQALVQMGIPMSLRPQFWKAFLDVGAKRVPGEYERLVEQALNGEKNGASAAPPEMPASHPASSPIAFPPESPETWLSQIDKDLHRTFPNHPFMDSRGRAGLRRILAAYSVRNIAVGYCQGMNFLAAAFMLLFEEEEAFWCMAVVVEDLLMGFFDARMVAPQVDGLAFEHLLRSALPRVARHLEELRVDLPSTTLTWFIVAFLGSLPLESCLRVWDVLFFEMSSMVLFRVGLALVDIYSQALLETTDSSEAYLLLQAMGPMSFDASRLVDTACIGFSHVKDAALRVLRDKYRPQVMRAMESMFSCDSELENCFELAMAGAGTAPLSRSQSLAEALVGVLNNSTTRPSTPPASRTPQLLGSPRHSPSPVLLRRPPTPSSPRSPLGKLLGARSPSRLGLIAVAEEAPLAGGHSSANHTEEITSDSSSSEGLTPPSEAHRRAVNGAPTAHRNPFADIVDAEMPPLPRRTRSAVTVGASIRRASSMHHALQQRIDLVHSLASFEPDFSHPKVATAYRIASKQHAPSTSSIGSKRADSRHASRDASPCEVSFLEEAHLRQQLQLLDILVGEDLDKVLNGDSSHGEGGHTVDIGSLAAKVKAMKLEIQEGALKPGQAKLSRRFTDGGALLSAVVRRRTILQGIDLREPLSPGTKEEKTLQLQRMREGLAGEVEQAKRRLAATETEATEAGEMVEALYHQLAKFQAEIEARIEHLRGLFDQITAVDGDLAVVEEEEKKQRRAVEAATARAAELKAATAQGGVVVKSLIQAVSEVSSGSPRSPRRSPR